MKRYAALGLAAIILIAATIWFLRPDNEYEVEISASPSAVNLTVDGTDLGTVESGSMLILTDEDADISATHEGFEEYSQTHTFDPDSESNEVYLTLEPATEEARQILDDEEYFQNQHHQTERYLSEAESAYENWPILHQLPEESDDFGAYQGISESGDYDFAIHVYIDDEAGAAAFEEWLDDLGEDIGDYEIIYHDDE